MNPIDTIDRGYVVGGVDTHKDIHVAAVVNESNQVLSTDSLPTTRYGYMKMLTWMTSFGRVSRVGVECSGTYGLGLLRYMQSSGIDVLEVTAPDKSDRRKRGNDDTLDAENAAHAAFSKLRTVTPKTRDGMVESLRVLKSCRKSAVAARTVALQIVLFQLQMSCATQLLITLGDNPERLRSESSFAALCGVSPIPASSGKTNRHRLNRGGDRAANSALHIIAIGRLRTENAHRNIS